MPEKIAVYIRLSRADEDLSKTILESQSVSSQRQLALQFIRSHPEFSSYEIVEYVDDGFSGTSEDRPQFQKLLGDIKAGLLRTIVVKDFSRFARNYILMGDLLEQVFPFLGVRFISINDHYDSAKDYNTSDSITVVLKSILNGQFSRDLSIKMSSTFGLLMQKGEYAFKPSYGYIRDKGSPEIRIDPEAADVVRKIFALALSGKRSWEIANTLNDAGIPTPGTHLSARGQLRTPEIKLPLWDSSKVRHILQNRAYTGTMVHRRKRKVAPCSKYFYNTDPSEQIVQEDLFEPLVSKEDFEKVQASLPKCSNAKPRTSANEPLQGFLRCGYCNRRSSIDKNKHRFTFRCTGASAAHAGHLRSHPLKPVEDAILPLLLDTFGRILAEEQKASRGLNQVPKELDRLDREITKLQKKREALAQQKYQIYEEYCAGHFPKLEDYIAQKNTLSNQCHELEEQIDSLRSKRTELSNSIIPDDLRQAAASANHYKNVKALERGLVEAFIEFIDVYDDYLEVRWRHHDLFSRIAPETIKPIPFSKEETK